MAAVSSWQSYFIEETVRVLAQSTRWFRYLGDTEWLNGTLPATDPRTPIKALALAPELALFEFQVPARGNAIDLLQTGFLILTYWFDGPLRLHDLLRFNDRFRQLTHGFPRLDDAGALEAPFHHQFFDILRSSNEQRKPEAAADHAEMPGFWHWARLLRTPIETNDRQSLRLMSDAHFKVMRQWACGELSPSAPRSQVLPFNPMVYADTRTYVWTCAALADSGQVSVAWGEEKQAWHERADWTRLLNIDAPPPPGGLMHERATEFERRFTGARSYRRWAHFGTLYGFTYHSGAALCTVPPRNDPPVVAHFRLHYFQIALLMLYLRVSLFRFSNRLSSQTPGPRDRALSDWSHHFESLRLALVRLVNRYEFPLLSNQQQAIEMYALMREHMDVDKLFEEVRNEVQASQEFLTQQSERTRSLGLGVIATLGLPLAATTLLLGDKLLTGGQVDASMSSTAKLTIIALILMLCIIGAVFVDKLNWGWRWLAHRIKQVGRWVWARIISALG
ncbi:MAG: hypothetical protein KDK91_22850 [Gammaproteobacteria bacterium]|nr:hypothetical protein [Gammaproteobacteria bacterium]